MRVGIDLDGVVYDFAGSVRRYLAEHAGRDLADMPDALRWEFYEDWGLNLGEFIDTCRAGIDAGVILATGAPYDGTLEGWQAIRDAGHSIHVVTDRRAGSPGAAAAATIAWLHAHGLAFDSITFARDKTIAAVDVMVDDKPENYDALIEADVECWLLSRPWNAGHPATRRVESLQDFARVVLCRVTDPDPCGGNVTGGAGCHCEPLF